jgi:hypothetical protein
MEHARFDVTIAVLMTIYVSGLKPMNTASHTRRLLAFWLKQIQKILGAAYITLHFFN